MKGLISGFFSLAFMGAVTGIGMRFGSDVYDKVTEKIDAWRKEDDDVDEVSEEHEDD